MVSYYHQVQELVGEMNSAGADSKKQKEIVGKLAEPLQRDSVTTSGIHIKMPRQATVLIIDFTYYSSAFYPYFYSILS